ncbi:MAG: transposase [Pyrinomonadaceae bacterium]|nr:transposase [Pyrinomonadaceae bacterium]
MSENENNEPRGWYSRGYLPHFDGGEINQFITYRLADSLPQNVLSKWQRELEKNEINDADFRRRVEMYLDQGYGECWLKNPKVAEIVEENLLRFNNNKYKLHAWVIMPNHVHLLLIPKNGYSLSEVVHSAKSYTANKANQILEREGRFWFPEPFDRFIRNYEHFENTCSYIENNPVKAGLCENPSDWRYSSAYWRKLRND